MQGLNFGPKIRKMLKKHKPYNDIWYLGDIDVFSVKPQTFVDLGFSAGLLMKDTVVPNLSSCGDLLTRYVQDHQQPGLELSMSLVCKLLVITFHSVR